MSWIDRVDVNDVNDVKSFANYCRQETGIPYPTGKQIAALHKATKDFFATYPHANWFTLCRIVEWAKAKKKRYATPYNLVAGGYRFAWQDGYLPELDPGFVPLDTDLEDKIDEATRLETYDDRSAPHEGWLHRLAVSQGHSARQEVYLAWVNERGSLYGIDSNGSV